VFDLVELVFLNVLNRFFHDQEHPLFKREKQNKTPCFQFIFCYLRFVFELLLLFVLLLIDIRRLLNGVGRFVDILSSF